jgi:phosphoserine phosphatase
MPDVVLIRPGCTDFDEQNRIQGSLDLPLSRRGQEQVDAVVRLLEGVRLDVVYSAPCEPARSTAQAICHEVGATFKESTDFCNLNHGLWQGLQLEDVRRKYPKVFKQWQESPETVCLPEGETLAEAIQRIERGLRKCLKRKRNVGIVASEPLATLIGCVLRGCRPELPEAGLCRDPERRIEFLHLSDDNRSPSVIASASAIGHDGGHNGSRAADEKSAATNGKKPGKHDQTVIDANGHNGDNGNGRPVTRETPNAAKPNGGTPNGGTPNGVIPPPHDLAETDSAEMPTVTARRPAE